MASIFSARRAPHGRFCMCGGEKGAAREGCARGNQQQLRAGEIRAPTPPAATYRRFRTREGGGPAAPRILSGGALLRFSRACSPIPWLQPLLLQSICIFFLFSNQSGRKPSTPSPSRSSWFFFRLPASTPSRSCITRTQHYRVQPLPDGGGLPGLPDGALPADRREGQANRGVLLPPQGRLNHQDAKALLTELLVSRM